MRNLVADGELNPTEAENAFEKLMGKVRVESVTIESPTNKKVR